MIKSILDKLFSFIKTHLIITSIVVLYSSTILIAGISKAHRVWDSGKWTDLSIIQLIDLFRPELFGVFGLFFLVLATVTFTSKFLFPITISYFIWLLVSLLELIGIGYYVATRDTNIDVSILYLSVVNFKELLPVFMSEAKGGTGYVMPAILFFAFVLSLYSMKKGRGKQQRIWLYSNNSRLLLLTIASVACLTISILPSYFFRDKGYSQSFTYNILSSISYINEGLGSVASDDSSANPYPVKINIQKVEKNSPSQNLVIIILESTRAISTSVYNPKLKTTPFLQQLASLSDVYHQVYSTVPHTSKAITSILCGIYPGVFQPIKEADVENGIPADCLARVLKRENYQTAFFQTATSEFENRTGLLSNMGYEDFYSLESIVNPEDYEVANYFGLEDDAILPLSAKWLNQVGEDPIFATYLTLTPHHNYLAPIRYGRHEFSKDSEVFNRYLNAIYYQDHFINNLFNQYKEAGKYKDTIFVLIGDHGEGFGEHSRFVHDTVIYNEGIRVPLLIHDPRDPVGLDKHNFISTIDIPPTVLDKMGFKITQGNYSGFNYGTRDNNAIFSHCWRARACASIVKENYKFIHHFTRQEDELFHILNDPNERINLAEQYPALVTHMKRELIDWRNSNLRNYGRYYLDNL